MRAVVADTAGKGPYFEDVTAGFVYVRLHGDKKLYASGYSGAALDRWATRVDAWRNGGELADANKISEKAPAKRRGSDGFCSSDNDITVKALFDEHGLMHRLDLRAPAWSDAARARTSAAWGASVSVRVAMCGRGNINKKTYV